jgi:hypothetical protein
VGLGSSVTSSEVVRGGLSFSGRAGYIVLVSIVAPIFLLVAAFRTKSNAYRHWLLTAFVTMYGATILIRYDPTGAGSDGVRHLLLVYDHYVGMSFSQFLADLWASIAFQEASHGGIRDPYKHVVSYLVGGVLGFPPLFFTVIAFVYGYFFTGSLLEIFRHFDWRKTNYIVFAFAAMFFLLKNIEGVNTVRTWTGLWILVYGCLKYYDTKKPQYIVLMMMPLFIHYGYFMMLIPALFVLLFGNQPKLYAALFVLSSVTTIINPGDIGEIVDVVSTTERGRGAVNSYLVEEPMTLQERADWALSMEGRWYRDFQFLGLQKWALNVLIYVLLAAGVYTSVMNYRQKTFFSIGLLTLAFSNSTWFLYAVTNRSWIIGCAFVLAAFVMVRSDPSTKMKLLSNPPPYYRWGLHLSLLLFLPYFLYNLSILIDYISLFMFVIPFLVWIDPDMNMSIKYVLQALLGLR